MQLGTDETLDLEILNTLARVFFLNHTFPNRYAGGGFSLPLGGLGGEGEGAELPQPQPQPHGGRDPPRFCDPYRRSGLLPLWGSRIGGVQVTIFDRGLQRNVILGVRGLGAEGLARSRGFRATSRGLSCYRHFCCPPRGWGLSCYQLGAFVLPHCTGLPRGKKCPEQMETLLRQAVDETSTRRDLDTTRTTRLRERRDDERGKELREDDDDDDVQRQLGGGGKIHP